MSLNYFVYNNNVNQGGGTCAADSDLLLYLRATILKFNHQHGTNISTYTTTELAGPVLAAARAVVYAELHDLVYHYHVDAHPRGFGRRARRVQVLGRERILNLFNCPIDELIYGLNGLLDFLDQTIKAGGRVQLYGLAHLDVLDCHVLWRARQLGAAEAPYPVAELRRQVEGVFETDGLLAAQPDIFQRRLQQLQTDEYVVLHQDGLQLTEKGRLVDVWTNYLTRHVAVVDPAG